ncbi:MAG TPA: hypothetical protein DCM02_13695, partial [Flavobacterium sp.]|nr:hypothetical protein [Flavobacterium sp.]
DELFCKIHFKQIEYVLALFPENSAGCWKAEANYITGDKITTNEVVGKVGNHKTIPYHLHYEILKKSISPETGKEGYFTVLDPSKVIIKGGKIYEKK